jgi:molybdopterin synthase sulfur carrier subunit
MKKSYLVEYWGILADQRGSKQETVSSAAATVEQLFGELFVSQDRSWQRVVKAVINDEFVPWDERLTDGARIAFLPPMSGG